jgi:hypothetical protein
MRLAAPRAGFGLLIAGGLLFVPIVGTEPPDLLDAVGRSHLPISTPATDPSPRTFVMHGQTYVIDVKAGWLCTGAICDDVARPIRAVHEHHQVTRSASLAVSRAPVVGSGVNYDVTGYYSDTLTKNLGAMRASSVLAALPNLDDWVLSGAAPMPDAEDPNAVLQKAFTSALKQTEALRKRDRSTNLDCTRFFDEFKRYSETEPYIEFFRSIGISVIAIDQNQRHYVYFELNHTRLRAMGLGGFSRGDRLVIVFTTATASSSQVTSFKVSLLNDNYI